MPSRLTAVFIAAMGIAIGAGCARDERADAQVRPAGREKEGDTRVLEKGADVLQDKGPLRGFDMYMDGFHVMKDDPSHHMEAHHYCRNVNEEFTQCVIFDGSAEDANLIGIEYIVSEALYEGLDAEEKKLWHPHNYEILSGELVLPGVPAPAEKAALAKKINSYGKTWHIWDTGHFGHQAKNPLPLGEPMLAWSYNRDGEIPPALLEQRDARLGIRTADKRRERADLAKDARPQGGVDDLRQAFPNADGAPPGVQAK